MNMPAFRPTRVSRRLLVLLRRYLECEPPSPPSVLDSTFSERLLPVRTFVRCTTLAQAALFARDNPESYRALPRVFWLHPADCLPPIAFRKCALGSKHQSPLVFSQSCGPPSVHRQNRPD